MLFFRVCFDVFLSLFLVCVFSDLQNDLCNNGGVVVYRCSFFLVHPILINLFVAIVVLLVVKVL